MWFITAVATGMDSIGNPTLNLKTKRTFGYFKSPPDAINAIVTNKGEMHERLYDYIVLENIEEGIHPDVKNEEWYIWKDNKWVPCLKPEDFKSVVNWALG